MQKRFQFFVALVFLVLAECSVGKNYQRPDLPLSQEFRGVTTADTSSIADIAWKQFFTDTTLQRLISRGITYNYDMQLAIKRMDEAQQRVKQAKLLDRPEVDLQSA